MSDFPETATDPADLASGEEFVLPGDLRDDEIETPDEALSGPPGVPPLAPVPPGARVVRPSWRDKRVAGKLRARKVRRLVRHVEPWSVLKISLIFYFCLWIILLIAGVILWSLAVSSGTVDNIETFVTELFALESFSFNADQIFRASAIGGLVLVVAGAGFTVLMAVLFNLISDLTGGMRFTVVEEETARPRPKRIRPRRSMVQRVGGLVVPPSGAATPAGMSPDIGPSETFDDLGIDPAFLPDDRPDSFSDGPDHEQDVLGDAVPVLPTSDSVVAAVGDSDGPLGVDNEVATGEDDL